MKIALVQEFTSTGGWSYTFLLAKSIKKLHPDYDVSVIVKQFTLSTYSKEDIEKYGIKVILMPQTEEQTNQHKKKKIKNWFKKKETTKAKNLKEILSEYDVIHYTWPYGMDIIDVNVPSFFIPHDFIYTHFVGSFFHLTEQEWLDTKTSHQKFIDKGAIPIVSSKFISDEFKKTFPNYNKEVNVVYLPTFNEFEEYADEKIKDTISKYEINGEYILYANNWAIHKNLGQTIAAYYWVKQKYPDIKIIITGYGTDNLKAVSNNPYYIDRIQGDKWDIKALGLIPNEDFSALMQGAKMVINASLIEAGAGSGLDAWSLGVPMVMSDIEAFRNQIDYLGVKAELFDPRNSHDIARAILHLLDTPGVAKENAKISKEAMQKYTWKEFAKQYLEIFEQGIKNYNLQ